MGKPSLKKYCSSYQDKVPTIEYSEGVIIELLTTIDHQSIPLFKYKIQKEMKKSCNWKCDWRPREYNITSWR